MKGIFVSIAGAIPAVTLSLLCLFLTAGTGSAQGRVGCEIAAVLSAPGAGDKLFTFTGVNSGGGDFVFQIADGGETGGELGENDTVEITFVPTRGWLFGGVECESPGGLIVTNSDSGFSLECENAELGSATCTINLVSSRITDIPTLSEWGMIAAAAGLAMVGVFFAVRRRKAPGMHDA